MILFKLFSEQTFEFNPELNLIAGVNGSGKSSLLKALAISLAGWAHAYIKSENNLRSINGSYSQAEYELNLSTLGSDVLDYIEQGDNFDLPVIAFYECDRLWISKRNIDIERRAAKQFSRFDPHLQENICSQTKGLANGYFSIWMKVFKGYPHIRNMFIDAIRGTRRKNIMKAPLLSEALKSNRFD